MGDGSGIEWTSATWNPVVGCSKVSTGCRECYAEEVHRTRLNGVHGYPVFRPWTAVNAAHNVTLMPGKLDQPLRWRKSRMVFVNSMSDLFHEMVPDEYIQKVFDVMAEARQHTFQILTKRPERMRAHRVAWHLANPDCGPLANVWLGVSIENRKWVGRADILRETPAAVRFISAEPLLGPLVNRGWRCNHCGCPKAEPGCPCGGSDSRSFRRDGDPNPADHPLLRLGESLDLTDIDWLILGGESGPKHRPCDVQWMRDLRGAAEASGTALFVKQLGGHRPGTALEDLPEDLRIREFPVPAGERARR